MRLKTALAADTSVRRFGSAIWAKAKREQAAEALEQGDKDYRACFNAHAPKERFFAGLTKEAQSLVDRLAGD